MPGFDGTGPRGLGPMTGGRRGFCAYPGTASGAYRGRSLAGAPGTAYPGSATQGELELLRNEFAQLQEEIRVLEARIENMAAQKGK